jgi:L-lactate dehydrogenase
VRQTDWLADACRTNPPRPGVERVRLPGDRAAQRRRDALTNGLNLHPGIIDKLRPWAERYGEALPV